MDEASRLLSHHGQGLFFFKKKINEKVEECNIDFLRCQDAVTPAPIKKKKNQASSGSTDLTKYICIFGKLPILFVAIHT